MAKTEKVAVASCPHCGKSVWSDQPYPWCAECGQSLPNEIKAKLPQLPAAPPPKEQGEPLAVLGNAVHCPICRHDRFVSRRTLVETRAGALLGKGWASPTATNHLCTRCGYMLWFMK
jgi:ribosomal protein L37E